MARSKTAVTVEDDGRPPQPRQGHVPLHWADQGGGHRLLPPGGGGDAAAPRRPRGRAQPLPGGVDGPSFHERRCPSYRPEWMETLAVPGDDGETTEHCVVESVADLVWMASLGSLEVRTFLSKAEALERPTAVAFDLQGTEPAGLLEAQRRRLRFATCSWRGAHDRGQDGRVEGPSRSRPAQYARHVRRHARLRKGSSVDARAAL